MDKWQVKLHFTVGKSGAGLTYRGYDVQDLAENCQFEEVAYLIFFGELPTSEQLAAYKAKLKSLASIATSIERSTRAYSCRFTPNGCDAYRCFNAR